MWGRCNKWLCQEWIESGLQEGVSQQESQELGELRRRSRLLEQENEVLGCVKNLEQSLVFFFFHAAVAARSFWWSCQVWTGVR